MAWFVLTVIAFSADPAANANDVVTRGRESDAVVVRYGIEYSTHDWPYWRGLNGDGTAHPDQSVPIRWSEHENIQWRTPIPGRSHGSPIVVGSRVYMAIADRDRDLQSVICLDANNGRQVWESIIHRGELQTRNKKATPASSTLACDGQQIYANFLNNGSVQTTALDMKGDRVWQTKISDYVVHQGYGASPFLYHSLVLVAADNKSGGKLAALRRDNGEIVWQRDRPEKPNYPSPVVMQLFGKDQLVMTGCDLVTSLDPTTGATLWEVEGATTECVTSTVTDGERVFTSGGYPRNHVSAVRADGSGKLAWENGDRVYVPSMLIKDGVLYAVLDAGIAACWESATGKQLWKKRLGGTFSSSPVLIGDRIYATNEAGETFVFRADPDDFQLIAENKLGDNVFATPAICQGRIFARVAHDEGDKRQEYVYCISEANAE